MNQRIPALLFAGLALLSAACAPSEARARPNVLLICLDTVRADRLGCYGYEEHETTPRLDRLAREGTLFADASANACWTKPSVPSFLTGTYPIQHGVYEGSSRDRAGERSDVLPEASTTLAEVFAEQGYATAAFVRNAQLRAGMGFEQGFELYQDEAGDAREIRWRTQDWLDARDGERPFFLYLHLLDAHWPYPIPDEYATRFAADEDVAEFRGKGSRALWDAVNDGERELTERDRRALEALYAGSLRYIDDELGQLFDWMERHGAWEDTVVSVVSDHGEEFGEHGRLGHGHGLYENLLRVPWILRVPERAPQRLESAVSLVDLFPTLLGAAGLEPATGLEGVDRLLAPRLARPIFAEHKEPDAYQQSLRAGDDKLVRRLVPVARGAGPAAELRLLPGRRYDVALGVAPDGLLRALEVDDGEDDPEDPPELKGVVEALDGAGFRLCGVAVELAEDAVFYGDLPVDAPAASGLREGRLVKVVAEPRGERLLARRVKLYEDGARPELELRGTLESLEGGTADGRLRIAGLSVALDAHTQWSVERDADGSDLPREIVHAWLAGSGGELAPAVELRLFDLATDRLELLPAASGPALERLGSTLDKLGRHLSRVRLWSADDQQRLDEAALEDLRALGYVR